MKKFKKVFYFMLIIAMLLGTLVGCGEKPASSTKEGKRDDVVITFSSEPETGFDPCTGWGASHSNTDPLIQSTLVEVNNDMEVINDLATDYKISDDGLTWTFKIRNDAKFTDNKPVTAKDVEFTFNTAKKSKSSVDLTYMDSCKALDDSTIEFKLKEPKSTFIYFLATMGIVPKHAYGSDYALNPIGSGPYKFVQWDKGEQLILTANENYYRDVPEIKKVTILFKDEDAALAAAKSGQVDVALTSSTIATQEVPGMKVKSITSVDNRGFTLPVVKDEGKTTEDGHKIGNNVTSDIAIRKALAYGIDREAICKDALNGFADPAYSECDGMPWWNDQIVIKYDIEKAKNILNEAGWIETKEGEVREKDGKKAEFTCIYPTGDSMRQSCAMAAAAQAKKLGININVEGTSWDDIEKRMFSDAVLMGWGSQNPETSYLLFHSSNATKDYYNPESFTNKTVDSYLEKALNALKEDEAIEYWKKAQWDGTTGDSMLGECPWVWLVNMHHLYYVKDGLDIGDQKLHAHGASWPLVDNLKEWKWN